MAATFEFYCCADTHGAPWPEWRGPQLPLAWLHAGDIYDGAHPASAAPLPAWLDRVEIPIYTVRGNHDLADPFGIFKKTTDVSGRLVALAEQLYLAGIGWCGQRYYECPSESDLRRVIEPLRRQVLRELRTGDRLILLTHYPPVLDGRDPPEVAAAFPPPARKEGLVFECVREFIEEFRPAAVVMGHVHEWAGRQARFGPGGRTLLANPGAKGKLIVL